MKNCPCIHMSASYFLQEDILDLPAYPLVIEDIEGKDVEALVQKIAKTFEPECVVSVAYRQATVGSIGELFDEIPQSATIYTRPLPLKRKFSTHDLLKIMEALLAEDGCAWDKEQTHESIRSNCLEEAYEVVDAIDSGDSLKLVEELGDLLLQSVFHCYIDKKNGGFDYTAVISTLCHKLVSRHTHIFGDTTAEDGEQALKNWEAAKDIEKKFISTNDKINALPKDFPAMLRAQKVLKILKQDDYKQAEIELNESYLSYTKNSDEQTLGRLLLALINNYRLNRIDGEAALKKAVGELIEKNEKNRV